MLVNTASQLFDANVFGLVDLTRSVLTFMQRVCSGHIVNVLSVAPGRLALEGFSAALAEEMAGDHRVGGRRPGRTWRFPPKVGARAAYPV